MNKIVIALSVFIMISCGSKNESESSVKIHPPMPEAKIIAAYLKPAPDSGWGLDAMLRLISPTTTYDSVRGEYSVVIDTVWGRPMFFPLKDSAGKEVMGHDGKPVLNPIPQYYKISKDSVNWRVENVPIDSLLKKGKL
jgi:hypothetical protein